MPANPRRRKDHAEVPIVATDWLDDNRYPARYAWPGASVSGFFMAHRYRIVESGYLFEGTFEQAKE
jgi:hypothetical protein